MENLSTQQSLRIIAETMDRSRRNIARNAGKPLLLWGSLIFIFSILIVILWKQTGNPVWNLLWFLMSLIGFVLTVFVTRNSEKVPSSELSYMMGRIWMWFGIIVTGFYAMLWLCVLLLNTMDIAAPAPINLTLIIVLLMGLCSVISGSVLRMRAIEICSLVATVLGVLAAILLHGPEQLFAITALGLVGLFIPGIILQKKVS